MEKYLKRLFEILVGWILFGMKFWFLFLLMAQVPSVLQIMNFALLFPSSSAFHDALYLNDLRFFLLRSYQDPVIQMFWFLCPSIYSIHGMSSRRSRYKNVVPFQKNVHFLFFTADIQARIKLAGTKGQNNIFPWFYWNIICVYVYYKRQVYYPDTSVPDTTLLTDGVISRILLNPQRLVLRTGRIERNDIIKSLLLFENGTSTKLDSHLQQSGISSHNL